MGAIKSGKRHEARQQIKKVLRDVEEGTVVSASYNLVLSGTKSRNIEGSITVGEKIAKLGEEETKVELRMYVNTPELKEPIESYITARNMASSLDKVHAKLSLPKEISENRFVEMATEAAKFSSFPTAVINILKVSLLNL